jgi:ribosomal protein L24E
MKRLVFTLAAQLILVLFAPGADAPAPRPTRDALQPFNDLIGSWKVTGYPEGKLQAKDFWVEAHTWEWQFKGDDAWLKLTIDKGKYFTRGELRSLPARDQYQLTLTTADGQALVFTGGVTDKKLILTRVDDKTRESQRLVFSFLHANRYLCRYEVKPAGQAEYALPYLLGHTKTDVPFAGPGDTRPECVVSGGLGTMPVTYKGQTYYVCCSGCRDAFKDNPEKYIKEFEERKAKEKMK